MTCDSRLHGSTCSLASQETTILPYQTVRPDASPSTCTTLAINFPGSLALSAEKRLIKDLIEKYKQAGVVGRPVHNTSEAIVVEFGLALIQILNLDEKNQVLTISTWSRYVSIQPRYVSMRSRHVRM